METTCPQLSVIVPAYNVERFLDKCLLSIARQTFTDFEVVLINDGSTDNTFQICREWAQRDSRFRLISHENQGIAATRNIGIQLARAELLMFVDSDDYLENNAIEVLLTCKRRANADVAVGRYIIEDLQGVRVKTPSQLGNVVLNTSQAYTKFLFDRELKAYSWAKIYDKSLFSGIEYQNQFFEDYVANARVFLRAKWVVSTKEVIYHYVQHNTSLMNAHNYSLEREMKFLEAVYSRYCDAEQAGVLSRRNMNLFRIKTIRRMLRTIFSIERLAKNELTENKRQTYLNYLSHVYQHEVKSADLRKLWRRTEPQKILILLFSWR